MSDTPETLASWIWSNYVGVPSGGPGDPYDDEYMLLLDRIKTLHRESFVEGLHEGLRQAKTISRSTDALAEDCDGPTLVEKTPLFCQKPSSTKEDHGS